MDVFDKVKRILHLSAEKDLAWVTIIAKHGNVRELVFMEASLRATLSTKADGLIQAIEVMEKFQDRSSGMMERLQGAQEAIDLDKEQVKEFLLRFVQIQCIENELLVRAGFEKATDVRDAFMSYLKKMITKIVGLVDKNKADVNYFEKYLAIVDATSKWDEAAIGNITKIDTSEKDVKAMAAGGTTECLFLLLQDYKKIVH